MKLFKNIAFSIQILSVFFSFFTIGVGKADAACGYERAESGCTIIYDGTGFQTANGESCLQFKGEVEYAAQGTVCATSPNLCFPSTCTATNTESRCNSTGKCSDVKTVPHPWDAACLPQYGSCTVPTPTPTAPPPTQFVPPPTVYVPPPTAYVPPPTYSCPIPTAVQNVRITCPYCQ